MAPPEVFESSVTVKWKILQAPDFKLQIVDEDQKMYVTKPSEIQIVITNYKTTYEFLNFEWKITPATAVDKEKITMSKDRSTFLFAPGALKFATKYNFNVTISNSENSEKGSSSYAIPFETKAQVT